MRDAIKYLFPNIADSEFTLQDDGDGPYIKEWLYSQPQPTPEQLAAAAIKAAIPTRVRMIQARLALIESGIMAPVQALIDAMPGIDGEKARTEFQFREFVERSHPIVEYIKANLPLTEAQIDDLFTLAGTL